MGIEDGVRVDPPEPVGGGGAYVVKPSGDTASQQSLTTFSDVEGAKTYLNQLVAEFGAESTIGKHASGVQDLLNDEYLKFAVARDVVEIKRGAIQAWYVNDELKPTLWAKLNVFKKGHEYHVAYLTRSLEDIKPQRYSHLARKQQPQQQA